MILKDEMLDSLLTELSKEQIVYVPKQVNGTTRFAPYVSSDKMKLDQVNTVMPPKDLLFTQTQNMYHYGVEKNSGNMFIDPVIESADQILFGVRSCDMRSFDCLDAAFLTKGYIDEFYQAKRDRLTTIAIGCTEVSETCFCESMGQDPNHAPQADIQLRHGEGGYNVTAQTEKGEALLEKFKPFCEEGEVEVADVHCTLNVDASNIKDNLDILHESHELWDSMSYKCLNCGTCTFVCPTCYCFDIDQENRCKEGVRFRCWDSCMFSEYTAMAGGHNPRPEKRDRVRNRFMHKLNYFEDRYGKMLCVGCGRCIEKCPVSLDITVLIDRANELAQAEETEAAHA